MSEPKVDTVIFDIGNVLLKWDMAPLIEALAETPEHARHVRKNVITPDWNVQMDAGKTWGEGCAELAAEHPEYADLIHAFNARWEETVHGPVEGTTDIVETLHAREVPLYALTNFSSEKFAITRPKFPVFERFRDILVSGDEFLLKPDPAIYGLLLDRNGLNAQSCVFIDDSPKNVDGARAVGMQAVHFTDAPALATDLRALGFPIS